MRPGGILDESPLIKKEIPENVIEKRIEPDQAAEELKSQQQEVEIQEQNEVNQLLEEKKSYNVVDIGKADVLKNFVQSTPFPKM